MVSDENMLWLDRLMVHFGKTLLVPISFRITCEAKYILVGILSHIHVCGCRITNECHCIELVGLKTGALGGANGIQGVAVIVGPP